MTGVCESPASHQDAMTKLTDQTGRSCTVRYIEVKAGAVFSIEEGQLTDCGE
jgi:hypothetical protein